MGRSQQLRFSSTGPLLSCKGEARIASFLVFLQLPNSPTRQLHSFPAFKGLFYLLPIQTISLQVKRKGTLTAMQDRHYTAMIPGGSLLPEVWGTPHTLFLSCCWVIL